MRRGEVWWANLPVPIGRRPVVLFSRDSAYQVRRFVTVAPVTTRIRRSPVEVRLGPEDGLPRECVVNLDSVTTIPVEVFLDRIAVLRPEKIRAIDDAIHFALGLDA